MAQKTTDADDGPPRAAGCARGVPPTAPPPSPPMKRFFQLVDWMVFLVLGACLGWAGAYIQYRQQVTVVEQSMCDTAYLLTRKSSDTIALIARQHACVRQLSRENTKDPFPYDTLFPPTK